MLKIIKWIEKVLSPEEKIDMKEEKNNTEQMIGNKPKSSLIINDNTTGEIKIKTPDSMYPNKDVSPKIQL